MESYPQASPHSVSPRRDPPNPEPDIFDGSVDKCRGFLLQCRRVFAEQPRTFRSDREKISYVINRLRGKALTWIPHGSSWFRRTCPTLGWEWSSLSGPGKTTSYILVPTSPDG
uniref:DUF4939 domain-containing protein n=1 Tax=Monopterus albus TaxID=43700 RepID=A0A3Q3ISK2_MONAL